MDNNKNQQVVETAQEHKETTPERKMPWYKTKRNIGIIAACAIVLVSGGVGGAIALNQPSANANAEETNPTEAIVAPAEETITLNAAAQDWNKDTSTPVIAHVQASDNSVDYYRAIEANNDQEVKVSVDKGYTVTYISPVNADGSIYVTPATQPIAEGKAPATLTKVPADQVTQEQADALLNQLKDAVAKGDETLSGDSGKDIVNNAATNIGNAPNVNKDQIKDTAEKIEEAVSETPISNTPEETTNNTGNASDETNTTVSTPSAPAEPQKVWVTDYQQQWVPNNVYVVDQAAYTEQVDTGRADVVCSCGAHFSSTDAWDDHNQAQGWGNGHSYSVRPLYETVTHPEVGHYEDQGHYENVAVGGHWE